ncbi:MAG TPA: pitrilysin family protein, partial [Flavobacteriales bacterium]|nr:pitrilysin family protein [Flavobacteriales bacterium]
MRTTIILAGLALAAVCETAQAQKTYPYISVDSDPIQARIYTLDNGLTVYLSNNPDAPRIQTNIAVRAGSKNDPATATGLAHYLEHMLFKGTSTIASADWEKEAPLLQRISDLYELRRATTDEARRDAIYHEIDSVSHLAATFAVPNEYDKMVTSIGAKGTNAYTSTERTVYVNDIPSNEMEKWMMLESKRFQECVLRLFHTELETVFEEFNRGQDNDYRNMAYAMAKAMYKHHPYGTQTTIGTGEHLKNPSMMKIHEYFDTYYVPNNMAVIMAGDLDYDQTIAMVDKYFGPWKPKPVPAFTFTPEEPITAPVSLDVFGPTAEWVGLGWRFNGYASSDPIMLELISGLLSNGSAGLIDLDLMQQQKVLGAGASSDDQIDYSEFEMSGEAKEGQKLEEVRDLLLAELEKVKKGEFDDWLIEAVVNNYKKDQIQFWNDNNGRRAAALTDAFIKHKDWKDVVDYYDRMGRITKQEVMDFASKNFGNNY